MQTLIIIFIALSILIPIWFRLFVKKAIIDLVEFRTELIKGQAVVIEEEPGILYQVRILAIADSAILFEYEGKEWGFCELTKVFPVNYFLDENGYVEVLSQTV
jgi:hypothetical protein